MAKQEELQAAMAQLDCGACGYGTCKGYADVLADGSESETNKCLPGGMDTEEKIKKIMA